MSCKFITKRSIRDRLGKPAAALMGLLLLAGGATSAQANSKYASIVVDGNTGKVLQATNADAPRYPASLTKIMTLYILFDYMKKGRISYDTKFYVTPHAASQPPSKLGLKVGNYILVRDIIGALVTKSANDVAATVAENIAGSEEKFARLMTARARALGMSNTTYKNASGLPNRQQRTTARDMAKLSMRIMNDFPRYAKHFKTRYFKFHGRSYRNHNGLLYSYRGMEGIKTGYTRASGFNLTTSVRRGGKHLIAVVMGGRTSGSRNRQMAKLLNRFMPTAIAMKGKRPLSQRIARMDPRNASRQASRRQAPRAIGARQARPATAPATIAWQQKAPQMRQVAPQPASLLQKAYVPAKFARRYSAQGFDIQIGSYQNRDEAVTQLSNTRSRAASLLSGHEPYIMEFQKGSTNYHRARFAGFSSRGGAKSTCNRLKRSYRVDCFVATP